LANIEPLRERSCGETYGVETDISDKGSIKGVGSPGTAERKSLRRLVEVNIECRAGALNRGRGKSGGRAKKKGGDRKLHGVSFQISSKV
jgi:hypothetical protein